MLACKGCGIVRLGGEAGLAAAHDGLCYLCELKKRKPGPCMTAAPAEKPKDKETTTMISEKTSPPVTAGQAFCALALCLTVVLAGGGVGYSIGYLCETPSSPSVQTWRSGSAEIGMSAEQISARQKAWEDQETVRAALQSQSPAWWSGNAIGGAGLGASIATLVCCAGLIIWRQNS